MKYHFTRIYVVLLLLIAPFANVCFASLMSNAESVEASSPSTFNSADDEIFDGSKTTMAQASLSARVARAEDNCGDINDLGSCETTVIMTNSVIANPGEVLYLQYLLENTGQTIIDESTVTDEEYGTIGFTSFDIDPGVEIIFRTLGAAPFTPGTYIRTATYTGSDIGGNPVTATSTYTIIVPEPMATITPSLTLAEDFCTDPTDLGSCGSSILGSPNTITAGPGETLYIEYKVTNTGQSEIINSVIDDSQFGDDVASSGFTFTPGQTVNFRILADAPTTVGTYNVTATYTGTDAGGNTVVVTGTYTIIVPEPMATIIPSLIAAEDFCTDPNQLSTCGSSIPGSPNTITAGPGETLYIEYKVSNTGLTNIVNSVIDDSQFGDDVASSGFTFTPGQTVNFRILADAPTTVGTYNVTATYTGTDAGGNTVVVTGTYTIIVPEPMATIIPSLIAAEDFCTDPNQLSTCGSSILGSPNTITASPGETLYIEYKVTNTGQSEIINSVIDDSQFGDDVASSGFTFTPGQTVNFRILADAPTTVGTYNVTATYTGTDAGGNTVVVTGTYTIIVPEPMATITPSLIAAEDFCTDPNQLSTCGSSIPGSPNTITAVPGESLYIEYKVTNTGQSEIINSVIDDSQFGDNVASSGFTFEPGQTVNFRILADAPTAPGTYNVTATYTGTDAGGTTVVVMNNYTIIIEGPNANFQVLLGDGGDFCTDDTDIATCSPLPASAPNTITLVQNEPYLLEYVVESTGTSDIIQHEVTDDALGTVVNNSSITLSPGQSTRFPQLLTAPGMPGTYTIEATYEGTDANSTNVIVTATYTLEVLDLDANFNVAVANAATNCTDPSVLASCGLLFPDMTNEVSVPPGGPVYLEYQVVEAGEVPVVLHSVIDNEYGTVIINDAFDITSTGNRQYRALQNAPMTPGTYNYTATYTGEDANGNPVTREASYTIIVGCLEECFIQGPNSTVCPGTYEFTADFDETFCINGTVDWVLTDATGNTQNFSGNQVMLPLDACNGNYEITASIVCEGCPEPVICTTNVSSIDDTPPVVNCPEPIGPIEGCDESAITPQTTGFAFSTNPIDVEIDAFPGVIVEEVCGLAKATYVDEVTDDSCPNPVFSIKRIWTVTDNCGNISDPCEQIITVEDSTPPSITFIPQTANIACSASTDPINTGTILATDNCLSINEVNISFSDSPSGLLCEGQIITRTWMATDQCGNVATAEQTIQVAPPVAPTISCPDLMVVECFSDINPSADNATVTTQCTDPLVSLSTPVLTQGTADCNGAVYTVTYTVTDGCGQTASCEQDFAIVNDGPTIACVADETVECVEDINPTEADVTVMTACGVDSDIDISEATIFGQDGCSGTVYQFTYTVTDVCGREASCTRSYTLENEGPEIMAPTDETVACFSDIDVDAEDAMVEYACALGGTVEVSDPVQEGDDDCPGTTYTYTYTVTDECGRVDSDVQVFTIQNAGPTIASPADQTVECASDIATDAGAAVVTTSCTLGSSVVISGPVRLGPENCPGTTYTYTYIVTDDCGRTASDDQVFTIGENDEPTIAVVPNITVDCFESINPNPNLADVTTACGNGVDFSVAVTDPVLGSGLNCPGEMYSVTYTITDVCGRMASAVQTYTIANDGPSMECPGNCEVLSCYDGDYNHVIDAWLLTVTASSSCSMDLTVSNNYIGLEGICVGDFTPVTFTATDVCGRSTSCESGIFIVDTDAPDIIGEPSELLVPCTGVTEDIFSDWLATRGGVEAYDACYEDNITWSTNPANPMALLDCSNGPQAIVVEFIVTDGCGNSASVSGIFNTKLLPNAVNVAGLIQTEAAEAVSSVEVSAYQSTGMTAMDLSDDNGDYNFEELPYEENTEIVPSRDGDYLNGVSTYDLILLQQHILDIQNLDSPYKQIAADVNRSGTISTLDLVLLRRLILHIDEELADNTSWRFVDADFVFPNPTNPFETDFPEAYNLSGEEEELKDFVAVKIGDLNLDAETNTLTGQVDDRSGLEELIFEIEDQKLKAGETYEVKINVQNFEAIRGFQMTLDYDQSLIDILDIERGALTEFSEANYNLAFTNEGKVPMSWNVQAGQDLSSGDVAFRVIIKAKADVQLSEVLSINSSLTKAEAYGIELMNVGLNFSNNGLNVVEDLPIPDSYRDIGIELYQNQPNPFMDATTIGFQLPEAGVVTLEVYDVTGKLIYIERGDFGEGYHQIDLDRSDLQAGILYYQLSTATDSESKKMIVLE